MKRFTLILVALAIVSVFLLTLPVSSKAAPICRVMSSDYIPSRIEFNDYIQRYGKSSSMFQNQEYSFTLPFPKGQGQLASVVEPEMVLAGAFFVPQKNIEQLRRTDNRLANFLIHLFIGSFFISLSGFIKSITNNQTRLRYVKPEINAGHSYDRTLSAET